MPTTEKVELSLRQLGSRRRQAPGPGLIGSALSLPAFRKDPLAVLRRWAGDHGDVVRIGFGPRLFHVLRDPDHIAHVLQHNQRNYLKSEIGYRQLSSVLGQGLVTSEGATWREHRRIVQPAFHRQKIAGFAAKMIAAAEATVADWRGRETIDLAPEMMSLTFRIVGETLLGSELEDIDEGTIGREVTVVMEHVADRMMRLVNVPEWLPLPSNLRFRRSLRLFDELVYEGIAERRLVPEPRDDLMSMLIDQCDEETGKKLSDLELRDEIVTMMGAGHETTASALSWTWWLLAQHPEAEAELHRELDQVLGGRPPSFEDVPKLRYTTALIKETMRLYPPVWILSRRAIADDEIGGYIVPKRSVVLVSPYLTHRHPDLWPEPEAYRPERFLEDSESQRLAYFPFGAGPRMCIGRSFAMMEAALIVASIAQAFRLEAPVGAIAEPIPTVTLRPPGPMPMKLVPRRA